MCHRWALRLLDIDKRYPTYRFSASLRVPRRCRKLGLAESAPGRECELAVLRRPAASRCLADLGGINSTGRPRGRGLFVNAVAVGACYRAAKPIALPGGRTPSQLDTHIG